MDTSLLVAALTPETDTTRIQTWLEEQNFGGCAISDWVVTEFSSALSIKMRTKHLSAEGCRSAHARFASLTSESFRVFEVEHLQFHTAARFAARFELGIRGSDALHLAICADHGATLCTLDRRLAAAAPAVGVTAQLV